MKKLMFFVIGLTILSGCTTLNRQEREQIKELQEQGVTVDRPVGNYEKPASGVTAAALNLLPGIGNFYLGSGNAAESSHIVYGVLNLLTWPLSVLWAVPEAAIDADNINKREMLYYYKYNKQGREALRKSQVTLSENVLFMPETQHVFEERF